MVKVVQTLFMGVLILTHVIHIMVMVFVQVKLNVYQMIVYIGKILNLKEYVIVQMIMGNGQYLTVQVNVVEIIKNKIVGVVYLEHYLTLIV